MEINQLYSFDRKAIEIFKKISEPTARIGFFVIFFWFGFLKILGLSPATPLVHELYEKTIPFIDFTTFYACFAVLECLIGILFLIKGMERLIFPFLMFHLITTVLPLFFTPALAWESWFVPTLAGQYIIKNIALAALAFGIMSHLTPIQDEP